MSEIGKLLYVVVVEDGEKKDKEEKESFRYTRPVLQSTLQLMGCKARHAFKISRRVFEVLRSEWHGDGLAPTQDDILSSDTFRRSFERASECGLGKIDTGNHFNMSKDYRSKSLLFELYKRRTTTEIKRKAFLDVVCDSLTEYKYVGPNQREDLALACRIRERRESVTVLLCGTSGCGKSTLSALLGSRLGVTTVISTDSIRHMMRSFIEEDENPLLWASTYHAGEHLDPTAVAEAKSKKKSKHSSTEPLTQKQMAVQGFKAQSEMVIDSLDRLITSWELKKESVVVEGVHLSLNFVMGLMKKHPSILPFMIYITKEDKHMERFAVRAKYMTLDPARNKYVKYIRNIRAIQEYLCKRADKHLVPKINNTNVDKSVAAIHATVFSCLRRREGGEQLYDVSTNTAAIINEEYRSQCAANSLGSKGMFQLIHSRGSSSHLMALINHDGSVARTWPIDSPLLPRAPDQVNVHFGLLGIGSWPGDAGGTSHAGSVDDTASRYFSSCCSSPRFSEGTAKEPKEEQSVDGSEEEEEMDYGNVGESDEDWSDTGREEVEEMEVGSVDEESTKTDEEYDDLAMADAEEGAGYWSGEGDEGEGRGELWLSCGAPRPRNRPTRLSFSLSFGVERRTIPSFIRRRSSSIPPPPRPVYTN